MRLLAAILLLCWASVAGADGLRPPAAAAPYLPMLQAEVERELADVSPRSAFGGQVEQETCPSLTHRKCWNPRAELKTSRENGIGLGQLTIAYRADGSVRFSAFDEVRQLDPELRDWRFEDRYDPQRQLRALVVKDRECLRRYATGAATSEDGVAMMLACYNGGAGGLRSDRLACRNTRGCDPSRWWGNVENTSNKSRAKWHGYGKSAFEINRLYPHLILHVRAPRYVGALGD